MKRMLTSSRRPAALVFVFPSVFPLSTCGTPAPLDLDLGPDVPVLDSSRGVDPIVPYLQEDEDWGVEEPQYGEDPGC